DRAKNCESLRDRRSTTHRRLGRSRACGNEVGVFVKTELAMELVAQQQQIEARLKNLGANREIPNVLDGETRSIRQDQFWQRENDQARCGAKHRRQRVSKSLKHARAGENNSGSHEIESN